MLRLPEARYRLGAPIEWRRILDAGDAVALELTGTALKVVTADSTLEVAWPDIEGIQVRGPTTPEQRNEDILAKFLRPRFDALHRANRPHESFCWLAFKLKDGDEMIFEVEGLLRPDLEALLRDHSA